MSTVLAARNARFRSSGVVVSGRGPSGRDRESEVDADQLHTAARHHLALLLEIVGGRLRHHDDVELLAAQHAAADLAGLDHGDDEPVAGGGSNFALVSAITSRMPLAEITLISAAWPAAMHRS